MNPTSQAAAAAVVVPENSYHQHISKMIGKRIQVQWNMSDGSLEWFDAIVQSCSAVEAVVLYDDGESYLLELDGEFEWRPAVTEEAEEKEAAATTIAKDTKTRETASSHNKHHNTTSPAKANHSLSPKSTKSTPFLQSILWKLTGSSLTAPSPPKKSVTVAQVGPTLAIPPRSSFADGQTKTARKVSIPDLLEEERPRTKDSPRKRKGVYARQEQEVRLTKKQKRQLQAFSVPSTAKGTQKKSAENGLQKKTASMPGNDHQRKNLLSMRPKLSSFSSGGVGSLGTKMPILFDPNVESEACFFY